MCARPRRTRASLCDSQSSMTTCASQHRDSPGGSREFYAMQVRVSPKGMFSEAGALKSTVNHRIRARFAASTFIGKDCEHPVKTYFNAQLALSIDRRECTLLEQHKNRSSTRPQHSCRLCHDDKEYSNFPCLHSLFLSQLYTRF